ncbi:uroporphyrinogen-III C-methyltransferase [Sinomonas terrae]|uniref:uroporphyrinogen-III C-methyltransferase n=1 Tax=Sinomonas terrae TaxID=2908838 RepID=A0ABS9U390_9MICC|nr:uroporphyrinogen-III C-methyltransferase [Sinomonas terrae]MCH6471060.1 uroporphyrinogen-III C-methyltransferase [Sinomonas terrae]
MQLEIALDGTAVVLLGDADAARQAILRYRRAGADLAHFDSPAALHAAGALPARPGLVAVVRSSDTHDDGEWAPVLDRYRAAKVPIAREPAAGRRGRVTLVGGGPGSPGLLTADAIEALRDADVVLFDRLAPWRELGRLTTAELVDVGKLPGHHKVPQAEINRLLVDYAQTGAGGRGLNVVRLKGGDPFVFGRGAEEMAACMAAGVPVRLVSGISSSIAVPAAAGIPVTHREMSHSFTVISGHAPLTPEEHTHLAGLGATGGTLVVLMGIANLPHLAAGLRRAGLPLGTPLAVVERGHQAGQRTTVTSLARAEADTAGCANPAVIVIGDVVRAASALGANADGRGLRELADALAGA